MGVLMMVGIVVSNSILIVEFTHRSARDGMPLRDAVVNSCRIRLRPILMTSLATIIGLIPMAMKLGTGSEAYAPLARAIIGGLLVSVVATVFSFPPRTAGSTAATSLARRGGLVIRGAATILLALSGLPTPVAAQTRTPGAATDARRGRGPRAPQQSHDRALPAERARVAAGHAGGQRFGLYPTLYAYLTAVAAHEGGRISAGGLSQSRHLRPRGRRPDR